MPGHRSHRHRRKFGLPEGVGLALLLTLAAASYVFLESVYGVSWRRTVAYVVDGRIDEAHYNAQDTLPRLSLTYEYLVNGVTFRGQYSGAWPLLQQPGLAPGEILRRIRDREVTLPVMYDPRAPGRSMLSFTHESRQVAPALFTGAAALTCAIYALKIYPAWRRR